MNFDRPGSTFEVHSGLMAAEAVDLFRQFYVRGNPLAPENKRQRVLQASSETCAPTPEVV